MEGTYILATDLDGTLVGNRSAVEELFQYFNKQYTELKLIYVTGRHMKSALQLIAEENLPIPDILICDVGSSIYLQTEANKFIEDKEWERKITSNWSPEAIVAVARKLGLPLQSGIPHRKRVSLHVTCEQEVKDMFQTLIQRDLAYKGIYSSGKDLDILPEKSGKGKALIYILQNYFKYIQSVLIAGNSGNDLDMLCLGYPSVIVGNAEKELQEVKNLPLLYKAKSHFAKGIKEGWEFFFEGIR